MLKCNLSSILAELIKSIYVRQARLHGMPGTPLTFAFLLNVIFYDYTYQSLSFRHFNLQILFTFLNAPVDRH